METLSEEQFLIWAASLGVVPDWRYSPPRCLVYEGGRGESRFWDIPRQTDELGSFLSHLMGGVEPWRACYVWPRGGCWRNPHPPRSRIDEERALALYGGRIPDGFRGAVRYSTEQVQYLLNLIAARSRTACSVTDDLFVVPDHASQFLYVDHHDVIHVECVDSVRTERFIRHMAGGGYTLPEEVPDGTFKQPGWMK